MAKVTPQDGYDGPHPAKHSLPGGSEPKQVIDLSLREIFTPGEDGQFHFERLANLDNDADVRLNLGKLMRVDAFNCVFEVRELRIEGVIPGTDVAIPPIRIFTTPEFVRLKRRMESADLETLLASIAHYDHRSHLIEMRLEKSGGEVPPEHIEMNAGGLKQLVGHTYHELRHAGGEFEFLAYLHEERALAQMNAPGERISDLELMRHICENYDPSEVADAVDEFQDAVASDEFPDATDESYRAFMAELDEQADDDRWLDNFGLDEHFDDDLE